MIGLEFNHAPGSGFAGNVTAACMDEGLLLLTTGWRETIRQGDHNQFHCIFYTGEIF